MSTLILHRLCAYCKTGMLDSCNDVFRMGAIPPLPKVN